MIAKFIERELQLRPFVSIGIPFYNSELTLASAIASVLRQTYENWELILLDDGSQDASLAVANSFNDTRIRVVSDGRNLGLQDRLNQLVGLSQGEIIARMDADDLMTANRIEIQVGQFMEDPTLDVVGSAAYLIDEASELFGVAGTGEFRPGLADILRRGSLWAHPTVMGKRDWFLANKYSTSEEYGRAEDLELWCRTANSSNFSYSVKPLLYYRVDTDRQPRKMRSSLVAERRILRRFGPYALGAVGTWRLLGKSYLKTLRLSVLDALALNQAVKNRKARRHQVESLTACQQEISAIQALANHARSGASSSASTPGSSSSAEAR